jgi:hypothetical protein
VQGKGLVDAAEAGDKVVLERADGPFGGVASVNSRGNKLEIDFSLVIKRLRGSEHSLLRRCNRGRRPAWHSRACRVLYAVRMQAAVRLWKGSAKI